MTDCFYFVRCKILGNVCIIIVCYPGCDVINFGSHSSNINEVIRAVLNLLFFYQKILHVTKALKALRALKDTKTQPSKYTKRK